MFDTAAQRGAGEVLKPGFPTRNRDRYRLKDRRLASNAGAARHAVAIDECRAGFPATLWEALGEGNTRVDRSVYLQRWFAGYHGDIGGGGREAFTGRADALQAPAVTGPLAGGAAAGVNSGRGHQVLADWGSGLGSLLRNHPRSIAPWAEVWRKDRGGDLQAQGPGLRSSPLAEPGRRPVQVGNGKRTGAGPSGRLAGRGRRSRPPPAPTLHTCGGLRRNESRECRNPG